MAIIPFLKDQYMPNLSQVVDITKFLRYAVPAMSNEHTEIVARLDRIEALLESIQSGNIPGRKIQRKRTNDTSPDELVVLRTSGLLRIFERHARGTAPFKTKNRFPGAIIQEFGETPWEIVPRSILVNRCETQKIFWPAGNGSEHSTVRELVERFLKRAIKAGTLVETTVGDLFPHLAGTRSGDVVVMLSPAEAARREGGAGEVEVVKPQAPTRPLKPWENGYMPPVRTAREEVEDEEEEEEAPASAQVKVEVEGFRSPRRAEAPAKTSWQIGGDE